MPAIVRAALLFALLAPSVARADPATGAAQRSLPTVYGVQSHQWPRIVDGLPVIDAAELDAARGAGFTVMRVSMVPWWQRKKPDGTWNFLAWDALYRALLERGITPLFMLANPRKPADVDTITAYCAAAAPRYPKAWLELGNEPDSPHQWPGFYPPARSAALTPEEYWSYARAWAAAWRAAQPGAKIATAGTSGIDLGWQRRLIAAGAASGAPVAAFGIHPYGERLAGEGGGSFRSDVAALQAMLPATVRVWVTEYGDPGVSPAQVTAWLGAAKDAGVAVFSWYELRDDPEPYGLLRADLSHKTPDPYSAAKAFLEGP
jgi:hypothetical protein